MEYTTVPELHPNPTQPALYLPQSYPPNYQLYPQNPNPLPSSDPQSSQTFYGVESGVNPPGVNASYAHLATHDYSYAHSHNPVADTTSSYYFDPNSHTWVAYAPAVPVAPTGSEQLATANTSSAWWASTTIQSLPQSHSHVNGAWKNRPKKPKTKVVQPAYCEVCKIDCTSKDVLVQHKLGKKHKKNLEKLKEALKPRPPPPPQVPVPPATPSIPVIGPQPKSGSGSKNKRKGNQTPADLEKKKMKVLEGGAAAELVKICTICNVICNSETVFNYHLAGQKHAAMMKKQASC